MLGQKGPSLDMFLLLPGTNFSDGWLPSINDSFVDTEEGGAWRPGSGRQGAEPFYPAYSFGFRAIADHCPVMICLKGLTEKAASPPRVMRLGDLTSDEWREKSEPLSTYLQEFAPGLAEAAKDSNPANILRAICRGLRTTFSDKYRPRTGQPKERYPFEVFLSAPHQWAGLCSPNQSKYRRE